MTSKIDLPSGLLLAFYGDDFTGSTDAMEVTARAGLSTILFTRLPSAEDLARFSDYRVIGVAGTARSQGTSWMEENLSSILEKLASLAPPILQYKVCSTFDSAPDVGSIGKAIEIGRRYVPRDWSPSVVGAPQLGRWQVFANLFALGNGRTYRIDRHPTMSRHPVTPMKEGDLRKHLAQQIDVQIESLDIWELSTERGSEKAKMLRQDAAIAFVDVADDATQREAGRLIWTEREGTLFSASSSGLQYALVSYWRAAGLIESNPKQLPDPEAVERLLVLSGSCSPVTAQQIENAEKAGFALIRLNVESGLEIDTAEAEVIRILNEVKAAYQSARGVLVFAAKTVDDPTFGHLREIANAQGISFAEAQDSIGHMLGVIAREAVLTFGLRRLVIAGGDTSGRVLETMPIKALELKNPLSPGAPLCHAHSDDERFDSLELVLKGGQLGSPDLFARAMG